jgi:hypothetical protein
MRNPVHQSAKIICRSIAVFAACCFVASATVPRGWHVAGSKPADYEVRVDASRSTTAIREAQILRLYMQGCRLCEIARRTHRPRQTVTKVVRAPDVQGRIRETKERLLGESDAWLESIAFAPSTMNRARVGVQAAEGLRRDSKSREQRGYCNAERPSATRSRSIGQGLQLGLEALRRAGSPPLENEKLEFVSPR